jgi:putative peptidoglycan lipid II flippase
VRALPPVLLAAIATGAGAWVGVRAASLVVHGHFADLADLAVAIVCAGLCYGAVVLMFRSRLPLGRLAR